MLYRQARFEEIPILYEIRKKQLIDEGIAPDINIDEALIGFLYLSGQSERMLYLIKTGIEKSGMNI